MKSLKLNLLSRRFVLMLTVGAMGATAWSSSAPNGRIAILGTVAVILGPDGAVSLGRSEFHRREDLSGVLRIATVARHAAALEADGSVWTWGENDVGQLGGGPEAGRLRAEPLRPPAGISELACGTDHCVAWRVDGRTWTWGRNDHGQLGDGSVASSAAPRETTLPPLRSTAGGRDHTLAVTVDDRVLAWGANGSGQLGRPGVDESATPALVDGVDRIVDVSAGNEHNLALQEDGSVWAWGGNDRGQLGTSDRVQQDSPVRVASIRDVVAIAAGARHSVALVKDGSVWAWGSNDRGENAEGGEQEFEAPRLISSSALAIAAGDGTTAVLESDGSILQLGSGPAAPQQSTALLSGNALFVVGNTNLGTGGSTMRQTSIARTACSSVASVALAGAASAYADQPVIFTNAGDVAVLGDTMNSEQGI